MRRTTSEFRTTRTTPEGSGDIIRDALANAFQMGEAKDRRFHHGNEATCLVMALDRAGFEIVRKPEPAPAVVMMSRVTHEDGSVTEQRFSAPVETETEKAARWASVLIAQVLEDGSARQAEAGVDAAAKEALARLRRDRGRMAFEDIDRNPPAAASHADYLVATWVRGLGEAVEWCEARLLPRRLVMTASLRSWPSREQQEDLESRCGMIRDLRGVVGVSPSLSGFAGGPAKVEVEIRFDFFISTVGCEYTPGDLPARPARKAA